MFTGLIFSSMLRWAATQSQRVSYRNEEDLASIKDSVLLDTSRKLELISDTTYKNLRHILDMRNDIGISHSNNYAINAFELLGWLKTCVSEVLNDNPTEAALRVQAFVKNLRTKTDLLDNGTQQSIAKNFAELPKPSLRQSAAFARSSAFSSRVIPIQRSEKTFLLLRRRFGVPVRTKQNSN